MGAGIYEIVNAVTGKRYVGSTFHLGRRFLQHRGLLRRNLHDNAYLQSAWNKYGEQAFSYRVLAILERGDAVATEQRLLDRLRADGVDLYNLAPFANSGMRGRVHSDASKAAISARSRQMWSDPEKRKQQSERVKKRYEDPEWRERTSKGSKALWIRQSEKMRTSISAAVRKTETRAKLSAANKRRFSEPGAKERHAEAVKRALSIDVTREKMSASNRQRYQYPAARKKMSIVLTGRKYSEVSKMAISEAKKKHWADPIIRERMIAAIKAGQAKRSAKSTIAKATAGS